MRQHVNPLSQYHQLPRQLPTPQQLFDDPSLPIVLDIGCARGRFLLAMAQNTPQHNHLGIEIRQPLVDAAEADRLAAELGNLRFLYANANVSLEQWLAGLAPEQLALVTIQFPDPWFKQRHLKRRVLQPSLLAAIAAALAPGRELFVQSDVLDVIRAMTSLIEASGCFTPAAAAGQPWECNNPLPLPSEREQWVISQGLPVYRHLYRRLAAP